MSHFNKLHISALMKATWDRASWQSLMTAKESEWLMDVDSMTERLKSHCESLTVEVIGIYEATPCKLSENERQFLQGESGLMREVVLYGDNHPWLCARTLMPNSTLTGQEKDIADLGAIPLGLRVFKHANTRRDAIEIARIALDNRILLARCSCLWVNDKRLLVSELFLPKAPIYQEDS